jgi:ubiquinol-cytochrome c reductase cytochrome b subunit
VISGKNERAGITGWLDERLPIRSMLSTFLQEPIPGGARWAYVFGSLCLVLFGLQAATGIVLAFFYVASPDHALDSITYTYSEIPFGRMVLGLHHWSANVFIVMIGLHLLQTFLFAAYKRPRELVWWSGVGLLLLVLGFQFTGFSLPWDQKGYWATEVGTSLVGTVPVVGDFVMKGLRGGSELGAVTLAHFYAIHVLLLPTFVIGFVVLHVVCLRSVGPAGSWNAEQQTPTDPSFYPEQVFKDAVAIFVALAVIFLLAMFAYEPPTELADPTDTTFLPRPEWNFLFLFQLLRYFKGSWEWIGTTIIPTGLVLLLVFLPFLDRGDERTPARRRTVVFSGLGVVGGILFFTVLAVLTALPTAARITDPTIRAGVKIFAANDCTSCHKVHGQGGGSGPDLSFVGRTREAQWLKAYVRNPDSLNPESTMPPFRLNEEDLDRLVAYLKSLQ